MANIKVTLELDDKDYVSKLKAAEAQTRGLGTAGAQAGAAGAAGIGAMAVAMRGLQAATMAAMTAMAPLLAAVATFQTVSAAFTLGDDISDLAAGSGIAAAAIINLRGALAASGGNADDAAVMIAKLTNNLEAATEMGSQAQKNLMKLGFSLEDIQTMTPEEALRQTIVGLSEMEDPIQRNAMAFDLLGRRAAQIDWNNVEQSTRRITAEQQAQADAAQAVGEAFDVVGAAFNNVMLSIMELLAPFADLIGALGDSTELGGIASGIFTVLKGVFAATAVTAFAVYQTIAGLVDGVISLGKAGAQVLSGDLSGASSTFNTMLGRQEQRLRRTGDFAQAQWNRIVNPPAPRAGGGDDNQRRALRPRAGGGAGRTGPSAAERQREREAELRQEEIDRAEDLTLEIGNQTAALQRRFTVQMQNIGLSENERQLNDQLAQIEEKRLADIVKIQQLQRLTAEERIAAEARINAQYAAQTAEVRRGNEALAQRRFAQEEITRFVDIDIANMAKYSELTRRMQAEQSASRATTEPQRQAIIELFEVEQRYINMRRELEMQRSRSTDAIEQQQLQTRINNLNILEEEEKGYLQRTQAERQRIFDQSRTFAEGLDQAMIKFAESVGDQAAYAGRLFDTVTQGFTDSILNFVQTGKLSFKDLFKSLMTEIIKMQINKLFLSIFGKAGPLGNIFGGLMGRATGGPVRMNTPYMVGERGPELFVPNSSGKIISNNDLMSGSNGSTTNVVYQIQAVDARSFKDLVARDPEFIYNVTRAGARRVPR